MGGRFEADAISMKTIPCKLLTPVGVDGADEGGEEENASCPRLRPKVGSWTANGISAKEMVVFLSRPGTCLWPRPSLFLLLRREDQIALQSWSEVGL